MGYLSTSLLMSLVNVAYAIPRFYSQNLVGMRLKKRLIGHSIRMGMRSYEKNASQMVGWITNDCYDADGLIVQIVSFVSGIYGAVLSIKAMGAIDMGMPC